MTDGQAQVSDGTRAVLLHKDVLGLEVSVGDAWLSCPKHKGATRQAPTR